MVKCLSYIQGCTLYLASDNKDVILAGFQNPVNQELVLQLDSYLTDVEVEPDMDMSDMDIPENGEIEDEEIKESFSIPPKPDVMTEDDLKEVSEEDIYSQTVLNPKQTSIDDKVYTDIEEIPGTLNLDESTAGVRTATIKSDNELWIYYNDSINLNNIMTDVINKLNSTGYRYLEFNRLARSDNAIVFEIQPVNSELQPNKDDGQE